MSKLTTESRRMAEHYAHELSEWAPINLRPMFGAIALYRQDKAFAMVWRGSLYFKVNDGSRPDYETAGSHPLAYVSRGRTHALKSFWEVPADITENKELLVQWADRAWIST